MRVEGVVSAPRESLDLPPTVDSVDPADNVALPAGAYRANLYVYDPFGRIEWYALVPQSFVNGRYFTLGRGAQCNITLNDGSVSTRHAYIASESKRLVLHDLQSTNGSLVNGERVSERALEHGDVVRLGATDVRFLLSYRSNPVHLVLDFVAGANGGKSIATYGASTNIGRLNCAINLQGTGVAAQHVRIDAFGHDLLYVVNLHDRNETWLNGQRLVGIAAAREGDVLQIGEHEVVLRVVDDDDLNDAVPQGDGTLLLGGVTGEQQGAAPLIQMSALEMAKLEAHLHDLPSTTAADHTAVDMEALADELVEAARASTMPGATMSGGVPIGARDLGAPLAEIERTGPPLPLDSTAALLFDDDDEDDVRAFMGPPGWLRWLLVPAVVGLLAGIAALVPIGQEVKLSGVLSAASEMPLMATVRGRVAELYFKPGEKVRDGDVVLHLTDLAVVARIESLDVQLAELRARENQPPEVIRGVVPPRLLKQIMDTEEALNRARKASRATTEAFNRREVDIKQLEAAQDAVRRASARLVVLNTEADAFRQRRRLKPRVPSQVDLDLRARLIARRERLQRQQRVPLMATAGGVLVAATKDRLRVGTIVESGSPLFRIVDTSSLRIELAVPGEALGAVEGVDRATMTPAGFPDRHIPIALGKIGAAAGPDGTFPLVTRIENDGTLRPGQKVSALVQKPDISALAWLLGRNASQ